MVWKKTKEREYDLPYIDGLALFPEPIVLDFNKYFLDHHSEETGPIRYTLHRTDSLRKSNALDF